MVKTYSNNTKGSRVGKSLFYPKAKCCATVNTPVMNGWLMGRYVATTGKKH
jgi:hypothetical protein